MNKINLLNTILKEKKKKSLFIFFKLPNVFALEKNELHMARYMAAIQ